MITNFVMVKQKFDKFKQISVKEQLMYETLLCKFTQTPVC